MGALNTSVFQSLASPSASGNDGFALRQLRVNVWDTSDVFLLYDYISAIRVQPNLGENRFISPVFFSV